MTMTVAGGVSGGVDGFAARLQGRFDGMFRLDLVEELKSRVGERDGWYLVDPGEEEFPAVPVAGAEAAMRLQSLVEEILEVERGVWTTMVYVQSQEDPQIIKVFHPRRAGCGCGPGQNVKPWWVLSRIPPEPVAAWRQEEVCGVGEKRGKWWGGLF